MIRTQMIIFGTLFLVAAGALLVWRPAMTLGLALIGAAVSVWRMKRPVKHAFRETEPAPVRKARPRPIPIATSIEAKPANENDDILIRLSAAGWTATQGTAPWLIAQQGRVRVALRTCTAGAAVTVADVAEAAAAKAREQADFAAVISLARPADPVAAAAKAARVHIINLPRLEPYLALALSFTAAQPRREPA